MVALKADWKTRIRLGRSGRIADFETVECTETVEFEMRYHLHEDDFGLLRRPLFNTTPFGRGFFIFGKQFKVISGLFVRDNC